MKKLLPVMAIALFISGCESSVNLPNTNVSNVVSQPQQTSQFSEGDLKKIGVASVIAATYSKTCPQKIAYKWMKFMDESLSKTLRDMGQPEQNYVKEYFFGHLLRPYMIENNIPLVKDNFIKLYNMVLSDSKLEKAILSASKKHVDAEGFRCDISSFKNAEQGFKNFIAAKTH